MHVKSEKRHPSAREYSRNLASRGRYSFTSREAQSALGVSPAAAKLALNRLARQELIASPARGFYVIVPPEYQSLGCLPADQFIPDLMTRLRLRYYVGLLSAAQYHGAAHHRPQEFQVLLGKRRRPIACGAVRVNFMLRKRIDEVPVQALNTPRGSLLVSTPEATAVDLIGYEHQAGGLSQIATVLSELAGKIDPQKLVAAAGTAPLPWAQRLGYLLERVGAADRTEALKAHVQEHVKQSTLLLPSASRRGARRNKEWRLYVNADVETEP